MEVKLMNSRDSIDEMEYNAAYGMLTCHDNTDKLQNEEPSEFIKRAIKAHHDTVLEHITLTFEVNNLSRACLQELARHRHISLSVESTRHTLKDKLRTCEFAGAITYAPDVLMHSPDVPQLGQFYATVMISKIIEQIAKKAPEIPNDMLKYCIPEFWATNLVLTANIRELRHILKLRTSPAALQEFQDLCHAIFEAVPDEFKYLLEDCIYARSATDTNTEAPC